MSSNEELACTYAALILHDGGKPVTGAAIAEVAKSAGVTVAPFWPAFFEKALKGQDFDRLILSAGASGAPAPAVGGATVTAAAPTAAPAPGKPDTKAAPPPKKEEPKKPAKKETTSEEEGDAFSLFG